MSFMLEVYYGPPADFTREAEFTNWIDSFGGKFDCREDAYREGFGGICLTYEFDEFEAAAKAADFLRQSGEHVEGPVDYEP
jgi:hypothetical protein